MSLGRAIASMVQRAVQREALRTAAVDTMKVTDVDAYGRFSARPGGLRDAGGAETAYQSLGNASTARDASIDIGDSLLTFKVGGDHGTILQQGRNPYQDGAEYYFT